MFECLKNYISKKNIVVLLLGCFFLYLISSVIFKAPFIGSADFIYFILNSRDLAHNVGQINYAYFPGVQWIVGSFIKFFGADMLAIQYFYALILLLGVGLLWISVFIFTRSLWISLLAGSLHILFLHISEGFAGVLEPFGVFFILLGFVFYQICFLKEKYWLGALLFSFFAAVAIFTKQQCLVFLVAMPFLPFNRIKRGAQIHVLNFLTPVLCCLFVVMLFYIQGGGLQGLGMGLGTPQKYPAMGSFLRNFGFYYNIIKPILILCVLSLLIYIGFFSRHYFKRSNVNVDWVYQRQMLFWMLSSVGFILQFKIRWYPHYGLYLIPCFLIPFSMQISLLRTEFVEWVMGGRRRFRAGVFIVLAFFGYFFSDWKEVISETTVRVVSEDLNFDRSVCQYVTDEKIQLIPPRGNVFHWYCGTLPADDDLKYAWSTDAQLRSYYQGLIDKTQVKTVFVFKPSFGSYEAELLAQPDWSTLHKDILEQGFKFVYESRDGILYRR